MFEVGDTVWVIRREYQARIDKMIVRWVINGFMVGASCLGQDPIAIHVDDVYKSLADAIAEMHRRNDRDLAFAIEEAKQEHAEKKRMIDGL